MGKWDTKKDIIIHDYLIIASMNYLGSNNWTLEFVPKYRYGFYYNTVTVNLTFDYDCYILGTADLNGAQRTGHATIKQNGITLYDINTPFVVHINVGTYSFTMSIASADMCIYEIMQG